MENSIEQLPTINYPDFMLKSTDHKDERDETIGYREFFEIQRKMKRKYVLMQQNKINNFNSELIGKILKDLC